MSGVIQDYRSAGIQSTSDLQIKCHSDLIVFVGFGGERCQRLASFAPEGDSENCYQNSPEGKSGWRKG